MDNLKVEAKEDSKSFKIRVKQLGMWGVLFFTIKGLLWLIIPFLIAKGCM